MALLPDVQQMQQIENECLAIYDKKEISDAPSIVLRLMELPGLPMHCPYHHFLIPAALLTSAALRNGKTREALSSGLEKIKERAGTVPGGSCGQFGCCGAAVGVGIFTSVWQGTTPMSKSGWAAGNEMTARCLSAIATVEGPRCCKRVSFLTVNAAVKAAKELLGLDLGEERAFVCPFHAENRECRGKACPFFPKG